MILTLQITVGKEHHQSHGLRAWGCGLALAEHVATLDLAGKTAVDLGCGLGIVGITAALRGADVTLVDRDERSCRLARQNLEFNAARGEVIRADWSLLEGSFDCVFGSEITYAAYGIEALAEAIDRLWNRAGPCALAASTACAHLDRMQQELARRGLSVRRQSTAEPAYQTWDITP